MANDTRVEKLGIKKTRDSSIYNHNLFLFTSVLQCSLVFSEYKSSMDIEKDARVKRSI